MGIFDFLKKEDANNLRASVEIMVKEGKQGTEIARELGVSLQTVAGYIKNMQAAQQNKPNAIAAVNKEPSLVDKKKDEVEIKKLEIELAKLQANDVTALITKERLLAEVGRLEDKKERLERDIKELEEEKRELDEECNNLNDEAERLGVALDGGDDFGELSPLIQGLMERVKNGALAPAVPAAPPVVPATQQTLIPPEKTPPLPANALTAQQKASLIWPNIPEADKQKARLVGKSATWHRAKGEGIDRETFDILWQRMTDGAQGG